MRRLAGNKTTDLDEAKNLGWVCIVDQAFISGEELLKTFIETSEAGESAYVRLFIIRSQNAADDYRWCLRDVFFDGESYYVATLRRSGREYIHKRFQYFVISEGIQYARGSEHYFITNDPEITADNYAWTFLSSDVVEQFDCEDLFDIKTDP